MTRGVATLSVERGQATLELAIFLPFFLLLLLGSIELGNAWHVANKVAQAAHEGVEHVRRTGQLDSAEVNTIVAAVAGPDATASLSSRTATSVREARLVTVDVEVRQPLLTGPFLKLFSVFRSGTIRIERSATALVMS
ncbi:MAG: pilus assembly protein [Deltaproteobacteria bacterium]|jgi:Flp pilus assembly protein TadG|nr:pilus assembly protein [Deltaproteobacteria bacterium]